MLLAQVFLVRTADEAKARLDQTRVQEVDRSVLGEGRSQRGRSYARIRVLDRALAPGPKELPDHHLELPVL